jgi:hypothetical protein
MPQNTPSDSIIKIGSDRVYVGEDRVVIDAVEPMDWQVREFCRVPIFFEGRKYFLRSQSSLEWPYAQRYELWLWPDDLHEASPQTVTYDESYAARRNEAAQVRRRHERIHFWLLPFYPLLGLCWSGFKNRVLCRWGFEPRSITSASVVLVFNLLVVEVIFVGWLQGGLLATFINGNLRNVDLTLTLAFMSDVIMRYSQLLKSDVERHWGFCEWLWPGSW